MDLTDYEEQLRAVEQAIQQSTEPSQKQELENLKSSILELLELTKENEEINEKAEEDEMLKFMSEIKEIEKASTTSGQSNESEVEVNKKLSDLKAELEKLIGQKCSAPHEHAWGATTYHNAIVCGIAEEVNVDSVGNLEGQLRVFFTNPTHKEMLPCTYYLEGECRFDEQRCHYSHGNKVSLSELRDFNEPDFSRLARNCVVLARSAQSGLWHRGRVICANFVEKECRVRLDGRESKERETDYKFEDLLPIFHDEDLSSSSSSESSSDSEMEYDDLEEVRRAALVQQSLFTFRPNQALGEWEQHTKGIGSKLMEKMGYVHGTGLGSTGQGIVIPISAQILPQGRSLDYCMQLREVANGDKDLFSVERKLQREKKKQAAKNLKAYTRESERVDVFSFLNSNILSSQKQVEKNQATRTSKYLNLTDKSTKSLNIESVKISDDIRRKQRDIIKTQESLKRNSNSTEIYKKLEAQLKFQKEEIQELQVREKRLATEQVSRKTKNKLSVF